MEKRILQWAACITTLISLVIILTSLPTTKRKDVNKSHKHEQQGAVKLSDIEWSSAGVLPYFIDQDGIKKIIVAQERGGSDKGTYDDFGGKVEKSDSHPVFTAAREFYEEAILQHTIGLSEQEVREYISLCQSDNTELVLAYFFSRSKKYGITYITDVTPYAQELLDNFYTARKKVTQAKYKEKDRIATIVWDSLEEIIADSQHGTPVTIQATVIYPGKTDEYLDEAIEEIRLRPIFVSKLKLFFQHQPYKQGAHKKVRFYSWDYKDIHCECNADSYHLPDSDN